MRDLLLTLGIACLFPTAAAIGQPARNGTLIVIVNDASGALVPEARVQAVREPASASEGSRELLALKGGVWTTDLAPGSYRIDVSANGFRPAALSGVRVVRGGSTRSTVRLELERLTESIVVERDPHTSALDPRGFSTFLSREQIDALPDDPEELSRVLRDMAPPGAVMRIDGFGGGPFPPKSQILSIRIPHVDSFSAEEHGGLDGFSAIDIVTRPGGGRLRGTVEAGGHSGRFNGRNPLAPADPGGSQQAAGVALDGPLLPERLSFSAAARTVRRLETGIIRAVLPTDFNYTAPVSQPGGTWIASGRLTAALPGDQSLRVSVSTERHTSRQDGVGGYNLEERAYDSSAVAHGVRAALGGPWGARRFVESRVQIRLSGGRERSILEAPSIQVLGAFTGGGAQATGGSRSLEVEAASDLDIARGQHAWRTGFSVNLRQIRSNRSPNYLGTFVFTSLESYEAGRPASFTRRFGSGRVAYGDGLVGAYLQDDYRVHRRLLLSLGVRAEWQRLLSRGPTVLPRAGLTWSPHRSARTTVRLNWGEFREWIPGPVYEQSLLLDGQQQYDVRIAEPQFPIVTDDSTLSATRERYLFDPDLHLARGQAVSIAVDRQLGSMVRVYSSLSARSGTRLLRGHELNPVVNGHRAITGWGNVVATVDDAASRARTATVQVLISPRRRRYDASTSYIFNAARSNTSGAYSVPASADGVNGEWGPSASRHAATVSANARMRDWTFTMSPRWRTGIPYTVILPTPTAEGRFIARPPGTSRNASVTPAQWELSARVSYRIRFGAAGQNTTGVPSAGVDADSARAGVVSADVMEPRRFHVDAYVSAQNVTNRTNYLVFGAVQGSPAFGHPLAAGSPRVLELGIRFGF